MPGNILVIQTAFPGDAILTLPMIQHLKKKNPSAFISVIAIPATKSIFESSPAVSKVYVLDKRGEHKSIRKLISFGRKIGAEGIDELYCPHRSFRSALLATFIRPDWSVGFSNSSFRFAFREIVKYNPALHEAARNLNLAGYSNSERIYPEMEVLQSERESVAEAIKNFPHKNIIILAPGSVWETKKYPKEHFFTVAKMLERKGYFILFAGSTKEFPEAEEINNKLENSVNMCGKFSIPGSVELFRQAKLIICNDSAPTHMAMAAGTPVLSVYCSTVPAFGFYPYSPDSDSIGINDLECKPCGIHGHKACPEKHFRCGNELLPEMIVNKALELIT